jgi:hypothetical protein
MALAPERDNSGINFLSDADSHRFFDAQARQLIGMSGDEFIRRDAAGEFAEPLDDRKRRAVMKLRMLSSFAR